jgi:hypothetical protein
MEKTLNLHTGKNPTRFAAVAYDELLFITTNKRVELVYAIHRRYMIKGKYPNMLC